MDPLAGATKLFAGYIIHIAVEEAGTSDAVTRPVAGSAKWLEFIGCNSFTPKPKKTTEEYDEVDADLGWRTGKDEYVTAEVFEAKSRYTTHLYEQLRTGIAAAIVKGTAQTPNVKSNRVVRAWVNLQERNSTGQDWVTDARWCEIRAMDPPAAEKKTQEPSFEFWCLKSTLNSINWPA